jgi:hypothetical protein
MTTESTVAVVGGTPGGIAAAVRAAREGHDTVLVTYNDHLGGMMAGGLSYTDTLTTKNRAPLLEEFVSAVRDHYRETYGEKSSQYDYCEGGYIFEPHVAEQIFESFADDEDRLTLYRGFRPESAERSGRQINRLTFESPGDESRLEVSADVFVEATYEGDVAAIAGIPYRVGRESRDEHGEQFAGRILTGIRGDQFYPRAAVGAGDATAPPDRRGPLDVAEEKQQGNLDLIPHPAGLTEIYPKSTGVGDDAIQAYNFRLCLSRDPENRRLPDEPTDYDRKEFLEHLDEITDQGLRSYLLLRYLPNDKADMNSADLPGENYEYPEASYERRQEIADRHRQYALGLLYFLQNDEAVPDDIQTEAQEWGLAADEFTDTDNFPWQLYVREARRIDGRYTVTENDARHAPGLDRTPVNPDSIAVAEYPLDSHACREERELGSQREGFFYASQVTRPSQIPYRALLPKGVDNLLVPVPLSATHVAYGTVRLEPTWMHIGEAAGFAAATAISEDIPVADIDRRALQSTLVNRGVMVSFFNEFDMGTEESWVPAVQYLGTKGLFSGYDARPEEPLGESTATHWAEIASQLREDRLDNPTAIAREVPTPEAGEPVTESEFVDLLRAHCLDSTREDDSTTSKLAQFEGSDVYITRGHASQLLCELALPGWTRTDDLSS